MPLVHTAPFQLNDSGGTARDLEITIRPAALVHMCQRHTLKYFDFNQAKLVNTFWPQDQVARVAQKHQIVTGALQSIAQTALDAMELDDMLEDFDPFKLNPVGVPGPGNTTLFFIAIVNPDTSPNGDGQVPDLWKVEVKTVAPDGASALAFTAAELDDIDGKI
jgi:hypothetical protein